MFFLAKYQKHYLKYQFFENTTSFEISFLFGDDFRDPRGFAFQFWHDTFRAVLIVMNSNDALLTGKTQYGRTQMFFFLKKNKMRKKFSRIQFKSQNHHDKTCFKSFDGILNLLAVNGCGSRSQKSTEQIYLPVRLTR